MTTTTQSTDQWFGAPAHTELASNDPHATTAFLGKVFGMKFQTEKGMGGSDYHTAYTPGHPSCGVRAVMPQERGPGQTPYINVPNVDAACKSCTAAGGKIILPKTAIPGRGWMAWMSIPGGLTVAAFQPDEHAN